METQTAEQQLSRKQLLNILDECHGLVDDFGVMWYFDDIDSDENTFKLHSHPEQGMDSLTYSLDGAKLVGYFLSLQVVGKSIFGSSVDFILLRAYLPEI